jgi:hypothetical protein
MSDKGNVIVLRPRRETVLITFQMLKGEDILPHISGIAQRRNLRVQSLVSYHVALQPHCAVCISGKAADLVVDDLWDSGHRVLSVTKISAP